MKPFRFTPTHVSSALLILLCVLLCACSKDPTDSSHTEASPPSVESNLKHFLYESDGASVTITGYSGIESTIAIPSEIDGLPVTTIAENAFRGFIYLEKVVIPDSVTTIDYAFPACEDLEYVFIGQGVTSMNGAFRGCTALKDVAGGSRVEYMDEAFAGCTSLRTATIPSSVKSALSAFSGCTQLTGASIENGITCLDKTFENCTDLRAIQIPDSVIYLVSAFSGCSALSEVTGGESVSVYNRAFAGCTQLRKLTLGEEVTELISAFIDCRSLETIGNLPRSVEKYAASFTGCRALDKIIVPAVTDADSLAAYSPAEDFKGCESAVTVEILADFPVREEFCKTFSGLISLKEMTLPELASEAMLRVSYTASDERYEGDDKKIASALKTCRSAKTVRVTDDYAKIDGISYSHIYGGDVYLIDPDSEADAAPVIGFTPFEKETYWCGYPTGGDRKNETIALKRTYSFHLRTTGKNTGTLPSSVVINGVPCEIGE